MEFLSFTLSSGLFADEIKHGLVSLVFSLLLYLKHKKLKYAVIPILVTYLIDSDHLVDYLLYFGFDVSPLEFVKMRYFQATQRAVVPFHAWEWIIMLLALSWQERKIESYKFSVAVGMISHLIWDSYTVGSISFYFILNRIVNSFIM